MDLEQFKDDMSFGADMAGVAQRRAQQQSLDEVKDLLQQQQAEQNRLKSLPPCPACRKPLEVGSLKCPQCHDEIVWLEDKPYRNCPDNKHLTERAHTLKRLYEELFATSRNKSLTLLADAKEAVLQYRKKAGANFDYQASIDSIAEIARDSLYRQHDILPAASQPELATLIGDLVPYKEYTSNNGANAFAGVFFWILIVGIGWGIAAIVNAFVPLHSDTKGYLIISTIPLFVVLMAVLCIAHIKEVNRTTNTLIKAVNECDSHHDYAAAEKYLSAVGFLETLRAEQIRIRNVLQICLENDKLIGDATADNIRDTLATYSDIMPDLHLQKEFTSGTVETLLEAATILAANLGVEVPSVFSEAANNVPAAKLPDVYVDDSAENSFRESDNDYAPIMSGYWLKTKDRVMGPYTPVRLVKLASQKKLKKSYLVGKSEAGPFTPLPNIWKTIVREAKQ